MTFISPQKYDITKDIFVKFCLYRVRRYQPLEVRHGLYHKEAAMPRDDNDVTFYICHEVHLPSSKVLSPLKVFLMREEVVPEIVHGGLVF